MEFYVARDGQQFGPYTLEDVNSYLASGELAATDLAWFEGENDWKPIHEILGLPPPKRIEQLEYYIARNGEELGPYTFMDMFSHKFNSTDLVWLDDEADWKPLQEVFGEPFI